MNKEQLIYAANGIRKSLFLALLCMDKKTRDEHKDINVREVFEGVKRRLFALNAMLDYPIELSEIIISVVSAESFCYNGVGFTAFRKNILDAGSDILRFAENYNA